MNEKYNAYMELAKENSELIRENLRLKNDKRFTIEAIQRFCPLELYHSAHIWLQSIGYA